MEYRPLEITLISADDIKDVNTFGKMDVYAVAFISLYPQNKKKTKVDKNCGTSPRWNEKLQFTIDERSLLNSGMTLVIQLKAEKTLGPDKDIGEVSIPIHELFKNGGDQSNGTTDRLVEYQLRASSGKPKGRVKFSYKFGDKLSHNYYADTTTTTTKKKADEPVTAYPPSGYGYKQGQPLGGAAMAYPAPHPGMGYQQPPSGYGYPPPPPPPHGHNYGAYPPPGGYPPAGYGYAPPPPGYGYHQQVPMQPPKKKKSGLGSMGLGLGAGLLGGLLLGDMVSDVGEMAAYDEGYEDAMGDASGFDF